jgi:uncharacterized protein
MNPESEQAPRPWYRQLWPWLLMLPPGASVLAGAAMVYLVVHEPTVLVVDDYSRIEALTSERFARDRRAAELGLAADIDFATTSAGEARIDVRLASAVDLALPATLTLALRHAADPRADREVELTRSSDRGFGGTTAALPAGRYDLDLEPADASWRLGGVLRANPGHQRLEPQDRPAGPGTAPAAGRLTTPAAARSELQ